MATKSTTKITKTTRTKSVKKNETCFVIMPFGGWFDSYYNEIYCPAITHSGLTPRRADDLYRPSNIVQDIWSYTKEAKIILADLSNKNPNVFYELGLAHALAKPAILLTQSIDDIPFDLRSLRIIEYDKNKHNWGDSLMESIENAIKETIKSPNETIPTAFFETSSVGKKTLTVSTKEFLEIKEDIDLLKKEIRTNYSVNKPETPTDVSKDAFNRPLATSTELSKIVGIQPIPRTEIVKRVWDYIKQNKLQDAKERRIIHADVNLQKIFGGKKQVTMFELAKYLNGHIHN